MAELFQLLQAPRYGELVRRLLGEDLDLNQVTPELGLGLIVESDRPEWHYPLGSRLWAGFFQIGAAAAFLSAVQLKVTAGTRALSVIQGIKIINPVATGYRVTRGATRLAGGTGVGLRDGRFPLGMLSGSTVGVVDNATFAAVGGTSLDVINVPAGDAGRDISFSAGPWVMGDGAVTNDQFTIFCTIVNTALNVLVWGYERIARVEELAVA